MSRYAWWWLALRAWKRSLCCSSCASSCTIRMEASVSCASEASWPVLALAWREANLIHHEHSHEYAASCFQNGRSNGRTQAQALLVFLSSISSMLPSQEVDDVACSRY